MANCLGVPDCSSEKRYYVSSSRRRGRGCALSAENSISRLLHRSHHPPPCSSTTPSNTTLLPTTPPSRSSSIWNSSQALPTPPLVRVVRLPARPPPTPIPAFLLLPQSLSQSTTSPVHCPSPLSGGGPVKAFHVCTAHHNCQQLRYPLSTFATHPGEQPSVLRFWLCRINGLT